jgi:hypothetical protein
MHLENICNNYFVGNKVKNILGRTRGHFLTRPYIGVVLAPMGEDDPLFVSAVTSKGSLFGSH